MVPTEEGFEKKGKVSQQRFLGPQSPVEGYLQIVGAFRECPDAAPDEITRGFNGEAVGMAGLNNPGIPP